MKWPKRILKIVVITGLIFGFLLFVLAMLGGNGETLKNALQDFIGKSTHTKASVETLNRIEFYPDLAFDFEGLKAFAGKDGDIEVFSIGKVRLAMGFWDMTFSTGRIREINITDIYLAPGLWGDQIVSLDSVGIDAGTAGEDDGAALTGRGLVGDKIFNFEVPMLEMDGSPDPLYKFSDEKYVDFSLGDAKVRLLFREGRAVLEPQVRGDDYCHLVALLLDLDIEFAHNCPVASPEEKPETVP